MVGSLLYGVSARRSGLDEASSNGIAHQAGDFMDVEFFQDPVAMGLGGIDTDVEDCGNLLRAVAFRNQLQDLSFPWCEWIAKNVLVILIGFHHGLGDLRTQVG